MKIGILTYHWVANFGANLQTLSTYKYVENAGHTPIIINWIPDDLMKVYERKVSKEQLCTHRQFAISNYHNITDVCKDKYDIARVVDEKQIDIVIIGSDAVFSYTPILERIRICRRGLWYFKPISDFDCPNPFWGDFYPLLKRKVKLVAMSASAQNTNYKKIILGFEKKRFVKALEQFSYVSVRDIWTKQMLSYLISKDVDVTITPDPVFAFENNVSPNNRNIVQKYLGITNKYAILSVTDSVKEETWIKDLEKHFSEAGIILIGLPQTNTQFKNILEHNMPFPIDPLDWYLFIKNSVGYIGELMHPILVSLHNAVPIFALDLYGFRKNGRLITESSKTYQIVKRFGLLDNYYSVKDNRELPNPAYVVERIADFDKTKCQRNASIMYNQYLDMMDTILNSK